MDKPEIIRLAATEVAKAAPPTSVAIKSQIENWTAANAVTVLTVLYLTLQIAWLIWQWRHASRTAKAAQAQQEAQNG